MGLRHSSAGHLRRGALAFAERGGTFSFALLCCVYAAEQSNSERCPAQAASHADAFATQVASHAGGVPPQLARGRYDARAISLRTASAKSSTSCSVVSNAHIQRTSPVCSSQT